jgi:glycerophosphoryl diester phosphodiesterase
MSCACFALLAVQKKRNPAFSLEPIRQCRMAVMSEREFRLRLYGHRGAPAHLPENTLEAFERALADGANSLEIDVHPTSDGHFMVAHDPDGRRMAGVVHDIKSSTLDQVKRWNVAVGAGRNDLDPHTMPTLAETFEAFPDVPLSIDLKPDDPDAVAPLMEVVARYGAEERTTLASFSTRVVRTMRKLGYPGRTTLSKSEVAVLRPASRLLGCGRPRRGPTAARSRCDRDHVGRSGPHSARI